MNSLTRAAGKGPFVQTPDAIFPEISHTVHSSDTQKQKGLGNATYTEPTYCEFFFSSTVTGTRYDTSITVPLRTHIAFKHDSFPFVHNA